MSAAPPLQGRRKLSRTKRVLFSGILLLLLWGVLEISAALYLGLGSRATNLPVLREHLEALAKYSDVKGSEAIHPYLGWCLDPQTDRFDMFGTPIPINSLGFVDHGPSVVKRSPGKLIVGICGGSVAQQVSFGGREELARRLKEDPRYQGREIEFVSLAMAGFKQPQQVMAVNYVMALGGEFDVLVNIDGYNEIALPGCENFHSRTFYAYPRMWHARVLNAVSPTQNADALQLLTYRGQRQRMARRLQGSVFRHSYLALLIWSLRDQSLAGSLADLEVQVGREKREEGRGMTRDGPRNSAKSLAEVQGEAIELWKTSSMQLSRLCRGSGILYLHVLQPNQYLPGSKPLSAIEREKMLMEEQSYGEMVKTYYPRMIEEGAALQAAGVEFLDLTGLFRETTEQVYVDPFCHFNEFGVQRIGAAIADRILAAEVKVEPGGAGGVSESGASEDRIDERGGSRAGEAEQESERQEDHDEGNEPPLPRFPREVKKLAEERGWRGVRFGFEVVRRSGHVALASHRSGPGR